MVSVVSESWRMVGMELGEWQGINLGSDRISAIRQGSQQLNSIPSLKAESMRPRMSPWEVVFKAGP